MEGDWTTHYKVYPGQQNRPKRVEKLHCIKTKPVFLKPSQTGGGEPFDFPTKISGVSHINSKHPCILCHSLLCQFRSDTVSIPIYYSALLLNSFFKILKYLLLPLKWSVHDTCILSTSHLHIFLFVAIHFELPIAWTFLFYFSRRFNLAGVDCSNGSSCSKGG